MARIAQQPLFSWDDIDATDDLRRLALVLDVLPDEDLMMELERRRGSHGRNDYPVRATWNAVIAGVVFGHSTVESLRRELARNAALRQACGFALRLGMGAVPTPNAFSNLLSNLLDCVKQVEAMFDRLVAELGELLPDLGRHMAIDSKGIASAARGGRKSDEAEAETTGTPPVHVPTATKMADDRRGDHDANWGKKTYRGKRKDGSAWEKTVLWFGYKVHLLVDSAYELPLAFKVTTASASDMPELVPMLEVMDERHPEVLERAEELAADKGYDSVANCMTPWDDYGIKPIIDIRNLWKGADETRSLFPDRVDTIVYDYRGTVSCICPESGEQRALAFQGFEDDRESLKYRCPAAAYGYECKGRERCPGACTEHGRVVRVPLDTDRRIFTPLARSAKTWKTAYNRRTAVERVNSRIDQVLGFEHHSIRGLTKMRVRVGLGLVVMLAVAVGWIRAQRPEMMRSILGTVRPRLKAA
jgi:hypothetical protein